MSDVECDVCGNQVGGVRWKPSANSEAFVLPRPVLCCSHECALKYVEEFQLSEAGRV